MNELGQYLWLEINLLIRNKRTRRVLTMMPVIMIYLAYMELQANSPVSKSMIVLLMSCTIPIAAASYSQFLFSWDSSYFDGIMARKNNFVTYVKAKYLLMVMLVLVMFIPFIIVFMSTGNTDSVLLFSILLFILGVMCFIMFFFGTFNDGRIELSQSQWFKYQGVKSAQFLLSFIIMLLPLGIYTLFKNILNDSAGKLAIALPGLVFLISSNWWIRHIIVMRFLARKYKNMEGYRKLAT